MLELTQPTYCHLDTTSQNWVSTKVTPFICTINTGCETYTIPKYMRKPLTDCQNSTFLSYLGNDFSVLASSQSESPHCDNLLVKETKFSNVDLLELGHFCCRFVS